MGLTVELKALFLITKLFKREKHDAKDITTLPFFHLKTGRSFCVTLYFEEQQVH